MRFRNRLAPHRLLPAIPFAFVAWAVGCQTPATSLDDAQVDRYEQRMKPDEAADPIGGYAQVDRPAPVELSGHTKPTEQGIESAIWLHLPDAAEAPAVFAKRMEVTPFGKPTIANEYRETYAAAEELIRGIERPNQIRLTLAECLRRTLENNYQIKSDGYAPAISTAQVVQAEAAFDVAFFANINRNNTDRPTPSSLLASQTDTTIVSGGIRKMLATGATVTLTQQMVRVDNPGFQFQTLNPSWTQNFTAELRQPLLRNFGIDFSRAQINIRKNERDINRETLRATIINVLTNTEQAYWNLVGARRNVVVSAELLAQAKQTFKQLKAREDFDVYPSLIHRSEANVKQREFNYIDVKNQVRNAEDQILNFMNDDDLPLSGDFEIIPVDVPTVVEVVRDRFDAVETALQRRPEIIQARHSVDISRLNLGIAKNQALPTFDVIYRMTMNGLGPNSDRAFDQMTGANFIDQFVGLEFAWNFGERAERAGIRIAAFQQSQAVLSYKGALDSIITDCKVALRNIETNYEQLDPSYKGVISAAENLRSLQERQETKSPAELDTVLGSQTQLATSRQALLSAMINYNNGIVDVERAKGTLLEYNNVVLAEQP